MSTLIETVRIIDGVAPLWALHMARLQRSGQALGMVIPDVPVPSGGDDRVIRIEITSGEVRLSERELPTVAPIALATSPAPHRGYRHKTGDRGWLEAARMSVQPLGADDALLLGTGGEVVEATIWTIGW